MRWRTILIAGAAIAAVALGALVYAQLGGTQTASGSINVTSTASADLYVCQPDDTPGPDCGSDDSGADETVFETLEDMLPGDIVEWDIRLKNVGSETWIVAGAPLELAESVDPGADCPDGALRDLPCCFGFSRSSVWILGKAGDPENDNISGGPEGSWFPTIDGPSALTVKVAPGDYEDLRLRLRLDNTGTENCDGNQWEGSWEFTVLPVSD